MENILMQSIAVTMVLAALGLFLGRWLKIPALLFYMLLGLIAGPTFLNIIHTESLHNLLMPLIEVSVAIIIFEAGLGLPTSGIRVHSHIIRKMITVTLPLTGIMATLLARYIVDLPWRSAALFGAIIVVTGPTVIRPLLRSVALKDKMNNLFLWESVWADCVGVILSGLVLEGVLSSWQGGLLLPGFFLYRLAIGLLIGLVCGWLLAHVAVPLAAHTGDSGLPGVIVLSSAVGIFYFSNTFAESSGVVSVAMAGLVLSRHQLPEMASIKHFKDQVASLIIAFLFVLLSAQINLQTVTVSWLAIGIAVAIFMLLVRPVATLIALYGSDLNTSERLYIGIIGPRGIIAAALASYAGLVLIDPGYKINELVILTFSTIFICGAFVSILGKPLARLMEVSLDEYRTGIIIIGSGTFSQQLAQQLKKYVEVAVIDSNPMKCLQTNAMDIHTICHNALEDELYDELIEQGFRRALVLTPNAALNNIIGARAKLHLGNNRVFVNIAGERETEKSIRKLAGKLQAFASEGIDIDLANQLLTSKGAKIEIGDMENLPQELIIHPLASESSNGGIKILRAGNTPSGKTICLILNNTLFKNF